MKKEKISPMMAHYIDTKAEYKDCILFYRLGDFYEMFFDDAVTVSRELELVLTGKDCGMEERAPMCGIPYHSAAGYISRLIEKGYKVAVCEQVEDPKTAKGIVKREVVKIVTPGTVIDSEMLNDKANNYLAVIVSDSEGTGMAFSDISTGELYVTWAMDDDAVINEIAGYEPREIIINGQAARFSDKIVVRMKLEPNELTDEFFEFSDKAGILAKQFKKTAAEINLKGKNAAVTAICAMLRYVEHTQKKSLEYLNAVTSYETKDYMDMDAATRRNLEICETMRDKGKRGSLLWVLDNTKTAMGARLLKHWLEKPLVNPIVIQKRQNSVKELFDNPIMRENLGEALDGIHDMLRITARISLRSVNPHELLALKHSIRRLTGVAEILDSAKSVLLAEMGREFDKMEDIEAFLDRAIDEEAPALLRDGTVIKRGYSEQLDKFRKALTDSTGWIAELQEKERERTGIKNLKISFNKVFGYYIEITKSNIGAMPEDYIRKQTLTNSERYITPELKEIEDTVHGAKEKLEGLQNEIYAEIVEALKRQAERLKKTCYILSVTDALYSLACAAYKNHYTMPEIYTDGRVVIKDGRHPVVERMLKDTVFVPNDTRLDENDNRMVIITGPNMAGKSTYMRQTAQIVLMAQIGSFVPAEHAEISVVDRIFTRVGAADDISSGQSTFMVEMSEVANILKNATGKSLIILDEIGRGTSTYDGLAIARSVAEYIVSKKNIGAKTLFATHYHELTELEEKLDGVKNYNVAVKKRGDSITFLRKIVPGGADESYGVEVAALAGVPNAVINRAKKILEEIENKESAKINPVPKTAPEAQIDFGSSAAERLAEELKRLDVTVYTPIEALNKLYELSKIAKEDL